MYTSACMKFYCIYVQGILNEYSPTENGDSRIVNITVKHLLLHSAGWDRDRAGDPVFWKVGKHMNVAEPVAPSVLIQYMMGKKLQFAPGEYCCSASQWNHFNWPCECWQSERLFLDALCNNSIGQVQDPFLKLVPIYNFSHGNEFLISARSMSCNPNSFPYERLWTRTPFKAEVKGNSKMAYCAQQFS